ncbi:MAG: hypothetical protein C5S41_04065 [Candidatus Methanomarinus sp.]|nr:MAG: hypothetical protein C5S41_04065 [ANME-2 cluster archaeon]KAF5425731.1 hypothetical protein C5S42_09725 [ANME-2 cluster archaeon]
MVVHISEEIKKSLFLFVITSILLSSCVDKQESIEIELLEDEKQAGNLIDWEIID